MEKERKIFWIWTVTLGILVLIPGIVMVWFFFSKGPSVQYFTHCLMECAVASMLIMWRIMQFSEIKRKEFYAAVQAFKSAPDQKYWALPEIMEYATKEADLFNDERFSVPNDTIVPLVRMIILFGIRGKFAQLIAQQRTENLDHLQFQQFTDAIQYEKYKEYYDELLEDRGMIRWLEGKEEKIENYNPA